MAAHHAPSAEQRAVIRAVARGHNVISDAVAGSGKTTTVLSLAAALPSKYVFQVTYNSMLKLEVRTKAAQRGIGNLEIHSYHSAATTYYDRAAHADHVIERLLQADAAPRKDLPAVDVLVVDEAQDMTATYFQFLRKLLRDLAPQHVGAAAPIVVVLGDRYQGIYDFKEADTRYLTLADRLWGNGREFRQLPLCRTYRITDPIAWFVNDVMVGEPRMVSCKPGPPLEYWICDAWSVHTPLVAELTEMFRAGTAAPSDVFVLVGSVKIQNAPFRMLVNSLVALGVPVHVPVGDDARLDEEIIHGKVVFTTYHQSKGRERPIVIVYGFDQSFFAFTGMSVADQHACPNLLYVAVTRASRRVFLLHNETEATLAFLRKPLAEMMRSPHMRVRLHGKRTEQEILADTHITTHRAPRAAASRAATTTVLQPTDVVRFLTTETAAFIAAACECLFETRVAPAEEAQAAKIPQKVRGRRDLKEEVSDLNGLVIPAMWEARVRGGTFTILEFVREHADEQRSKILRRAIERLPAACEAPADFLYVANLYAAIRNKLYHRVAQLRSFDWLKPAAVAQCMATLERHLTPQITRHEVPLQHTFTSAEYGKIQLKGVIDAIDDDTLWELKCVGSLTLEHHAQLIVYAWMWKKKREATQGPRRFCLLNVRTGELRELRADDADRARLLDDVVTRILTNRFRDQARLSDEMFLRRAFGGAEGDGDGDQPLSTQAENP